MTTVYHDKRGLFLKVGGHFARPPKGLDISSLIKVGDTVKAKHIGGTPTVKVITANGDEHLWNTDGMYGGTTRDQKYTRMFKGYTDWHFGLEE